MIEFNRILDIAWVKNGTYDFTKKHEIEPTLQDSSGVNLFDDNMLRGLYVEHKESYYLDNTDVALSSTKYKNDMGEQIIKIVNKLIDLIDIYDYHPHSKTSFGDDGVGL